ncbi:Alpha/Beta hydrolase protein [Cladorrhinum sp. PSN332]|nr:Alpha/Beta hydrolase protein [Cladorrhinum sp. PSN332]
MEDHPISLPHKPGASLRYSLYTPPSPSPLSNHLLLFLNGLILPRSSWSPTITRLLSHRTNSNLPLPKILTYDRYGQGDSSPDPSDPPSTPYGHDALEITSDLHHLLTQLSLHKSPLIIIASSIGCPLARLYCSPGSKPNNISALLFLDSMISSTDFVSLFPNPDSPDFDPDGLPDEISPEDLRHARTKFKQHFHPTVPNPERFDRRNLAQLLPHADKPLLLPQSVDANGNPRAPRLVVVGHDWDEFAEQCEKGSLSVSKAVINTYMNPAWGKYNEGLTHLAGPHRISQVKIAKGCGHFIQQDDPVFVAQEINNLLDDLIK